MNPDKMLEDMTMEHLLKWGVFFKLRNAESEGPAMSNRQLKELKGMV